jgi:hypothetical protein
MYCERFQPPFLPPLKRKETPPNGDATNQNHNLTEQFVRVVLANDVDALEG